MTTRQWRLPGDGGSTGAGEPSRLKTTLYCNAAFLGLFKLWLLTVLHCLVNESLQGIFLLVREVSASL